MSFLDNLIEKAGFVSKEKAAIPSIASANSTDPFAIWKGSKKVDPSKAFDVYSGWVYACIRAIGEEIQKMELELYEVKGKDGEENRLHESELLDILEAPNENMTGMDMRFTLASHLEMIGNAYLFLDGVKDIKGKPTGMYLLDASRVRVIVNKDNFPHRVSHYEYRTETSVHKFETYQIVHLKYSDPSNIFEGIGTVQTAAQWIDADNYAMEFNRRYFLNGAKIGGFLEATQAYTTEQLEYIRKSFENAHSGVNNSHKTIALPQGTKYTAGGESQKDMDFSNMMTMMRDRILAAFRVPRTALGITDDVNRANAEATDYVFAARTILPKMQIICSYLNEFLAPRYGENIYLTFNNPVPENREQTMREIAAALGSAPMMSVNEAREEYFGLDPVENGDAVMTNFSMTPLGEPKAKSVHIHSEKCSHGSKTRTKNFTKRPAARNAEKRSSIAEALALAVTEEIKSINKAVKKAKKKKNINTLTDKEFDPIYKAFKTRVTSYENAMEKGIKKLNLDLQKEVLLNLDSAIKDVDGDDLLDYDNTVGAMVDLSTPILRELYSKEGAEAAALLGFTIDPLNPTTKKALDKSIKLLAKSYTDETVALLKSKLEKGLADGLGLAALKKEVDSVFEFSDEVRALRIARTETFRVANEGTKEAWKQTGVVKTIRWYTADSDACDYCQPMNGKVISIDENFYNKGDVHTGANGQKLSLDYANVEAGSLHVMCRCYTRPDEISLD